jgi:hypothetical protein
VRGKPKGRVPKRKCTSRSFDNATTGDGRWSKDRSCAAALFLPGTVYLAVLHGVPHSVNQIVVLVAVLDNVTARIAS